MPSLARFRKIHSKDEQKTTKVVDQKPVEVLVHQPAVEDVVSETTTDTLSSKLKAVFGFQKKTLTIEEHAENIEGMTKTELDEYAEKYDIYLDRRQTKPNMINEFIQKLKEKQ